MKFVKILGFLIVPTIAGLTIANLRHDATVASVSQRNSINSFQIADRNLTVTGTIERVWEDGFRLNTGDRNYHVDSWEVCGDNTASHLAPGDRVTVTGELEGGEFDAYAIVKDNGTPQGLAICR
ncbi:hypothetical protein [Baaleninema sp.]|uniref:hypothetical protein n=1 Tax=Baaleninema sp. TaxID=3101197 RepID=UPI003CFFDB43